MAFSKNFPKTVEGSNYPKWIEVSLTTDEESAVEEQARIENIQLMKQCIEEAKTILDEKCLKHYQTDIIHMAISLFEKRASHSVYWKEEKAKEKFDSAYQS